MACTAQSTSANTSVGRRCGRYTAQKRRKGPAPVRARAASIQSRGVESRRVERNATKNPVFFQRKRSRTVPRKAAPERNGDLRKPEQIAKAIHDPAVVQQPAEGEQRADRWQHIGQKEQALQPLCSAARPGSATG